MFLLTVAKAHGTSMPKPKYDKIKSKRLKTPFETKTVIQNHYICNLVSDFFCTKLEVVGETKMN